MKSNLFVYDKNTLQSLMSYLEGYRFISIAYFFYRFETLSELEDLEGDQFENSVIDITNLVKDANYYRIFTERYLWTLTEKIENLHFCMHYNTFESFIETFPYMFEQRNINFDFHIDVRINKEKDGEVTPAKLPDLYIYRNLAEVQRLFKEGRLISLSNLIDECDGIVFRYNIDHICNGIDKCKVEFIDLSSIVRTLKMRRDLIFQFELLIKRTSAVKKIKYCI